MSYGAGGDVKLFVVVAVVIVAVGALTLLFGAPIVDGVTGIFEPGIGLKTAAVWSFFLTVAVMVVFALVAGDSLIGEIQFMIGGFFSFFFMFTVLIAWVF